MIRLLLIFILCFYAFGANVKEKIEDKKESLKSTKKLEDELNKKLDELASDIFKSEKSVKSRALEIDNLSKQVAQLESNAKIAIGELDKLTTQNTTLIQKQKDMEEKLIRIISEDFAYDLIAPQEYLESEESIIINEILIKLNLSMQNEIKNIIKNYENTTNLIKDQSGKINKIKLSLKDFRQKKAKLQELQASQKQMIATLKIDKENYSKQLEKLQAQQEELRKTLENLQIISKRTEEPKNQIQQNTTTIKQIGSSYRTSSVKKYIGAKTIAPLDSFTIKQKFGDYIDPIYNIKIFNESIILRSNELNAKVRSVLDGTIVFAKDTAILNKVIIVENSNGIHTIYAHLDKIAPTIKVGNKVKKGYVIGRVKQDLTFEVTQKNYHINPLELISLK